MRTLSPFWLAFESILANKNTRKFLPFLRLDSAVESAELVKD
jgi:hypothetical protein